MTNRRRKILYINVVDVSVDQFIWFKTFYRFISFKILCIKYRSWLLVMIFVIISKCWEDCLDFKSVNTFVGWIRVVQDRNRYWASVNMVVTLLFELLTTRFFSEFRSGHKIPLAIWASCLNTHVNQSTICSLNKINYLFFTPFLIIFFYKITGFKSWNNVYYIEFFWDLGFSQR
jgi:hypothetical protein